jgi:ClpX C4-type zinc finger
MRWRKLACSFCGKDADAVERLVAGVARCNEILGEHPPGAARSYSAIARPVNDRPWWQRVLGWWSARALEGVRGEVSGGG